jgi:hypothetical protein
MQQEATFPATPDALCSQQLIKSPWNLAGIAGEEAFDG